MIPAEHSVSLLRLISPDVQAASRWLHATLGWSIEPAKNLGQGVWFARNAQGVVALLTSTPPQRAEDAAHWDHFIGVPSIAMTLQRADVLGWKTMVRPVQMERLGSIALLHDPTGVPLWLWQGRVLFGFPITTGPGGIAGFEIRSQNPAATGQGLTAMLGWSQDGQRLAVPGPTTAWVRGVPREGMPGHWLTAIAVSDLSATVAAALAAGGRLVEPASEHPTLGTCALVANDAAGPLLLSQI